MRPTSVESRLRNRVVLLSSSLIVFLTVLLCAPRDASAQTAESDPDYRRHFIGSSLFILANLVPQSNPPSSIS